MLIQVQTGKRYHFFCPAFLKTCVSPKYIWNNDQPKTSTLFKASSTAHSGMVNSKPHNSHHFSLCKLTCKRTAPFCGNLQHVNREDRKGPRWSGPPTYEFLPDRSLVPPQAQLPFPGLWPLELHPLPSSARIPRPREVTPRKEL